MTAAAHPADVSQVCGVCSSAQGWGESGMREKLREQEWRRGDRWHGGTVGNEEVITEGDQGWGSPVTSRTVPRIHWEGAVVGPLLGVLFLCKWCGGVR